MSAQIEINQDYAALQSCEDAIRGKFRELSGRMDIRRLWTRDDTYYFRVNWWRRRGSTVEQYIAGSVFVIVEQTDDDSTVRQEVEQAA